MKLFSFINKSIQRKMFLYLILATVIPTAVIGGSSYLISIDILEKKVSDSVSDTLGFIKNGIENEMRQVEQISNYMYINNDIKKILSKDFVPSTPEAYYAFVKASEAFSLYSIHSRNFSYITSIKVLGDNGENLAYGEDVAYLHYNQLSDLKNNSWYANVEELNGLVYWIGKDNNYNRPARASENKHLVSMVRMIKDMNMVDNIGVIYISFDNAMFKEMLGNISIRNGGEILIIDNKDEIIYSSDNFDLERGKQHLELIKSQKNKQGTVLERETSEKQLIAYNYIPRYDWLVVESIPYNELIKDNQLIFKVTLSVFAICLLLSGLIWYLLAYKFVKPIKNLIVTMRSIREGQLVAKAEIQSEDEIGVLSSSFNYMIDRLHTLFLKVLEEQEMKKNAEYKALQSQINPHFLFNTLNSIRWMAIIQRADNIKETIDILGRLLENSTNSVKTFLCLEDELQNAKDYFSIQKIRYKDKFDVKYDIDPNLLECMCIKFMLQPIIENAIFHGIEPKLGFGMIEISAHQVGQDIHIIVRDDGIGMDKQAAHNLLFGWNETKGSDSIGIKNVNERMKMTYGEAYGISIESRLQEFTEVKLTLPLQYEIRKEKSSHD